MTLPEEWDELAAWFTAKYARFSKRIVIRMVRSLIDSAMEEERKNIVEWLRSKEGHSTAYDGGCQEKAVVSTCDALADAIHLQEHKR